MWSNLTGLHLRPHKDANVVPDKVVRDDLEEVCVEALALVEGELDGAAHPRRHPLHLGTDPLGVVGAALVPGRIHLVCCMWDRQSGIIHAL